MGKFFFVISILLFYLLPTSLPAQEFSEERREGQEITLKAPPDPKIQNIDLKGPFFPDHLFPPKINTLLRMRQDLLSKGDQQGPYAILLIIQTLQEKEAIQNLKHLSQILLWEAIEAFQKGDSAQANSLIDAALKISPDFPPIYTFISRKGWSEQPWNLFENISKSLKAWEMNMRDFWYFISFLQLLFSAFLLSALLFTGVFIILILLRSSPSLAHLSWEWSGKKISGFNQWGFILLLFLFPLFWDLNIFWIFLFWISITWFFSGRAEKWVMASAVTTLLILLYTGPFWGVLFTAEKDKNLQVMTDSIKGEWISRDRIFEDNLDQLPWPMQFTAASLKKREGSCVEAVSLYQQLLRKATRNEKPLILNNLGNCYFYQERLDKAIRTYQSAIQEFPSFVAAYYNLSQTYRERLEFEKGEEIYQKALEQDEQRVSYFSFLTTLGNQYQVIDQTFGMNEIWKYLLGQREESVSDKVWRFMVGDFTKNQVVYTFFGWLILTTFLVFKGPQFRTTQKCQFCSVTICKKCQHHLMDHTACRKCWNNLKGKPVTYFARTSKKGGSKGPGIHLFLGGLILPGSVPIFLHQTVKGAFWLFIFLYFLVIFILKQNGVFMVSDGINLIQGTGSVVPWIFGLTFFWIFLFFDLKRNLKVE